MRRYSEMNVTPLIDILLVLLVVFLTALPLTQRGIDSTLPSTEKAPPDAAPTAQIVLEYSSDGRIAINQEQVALPGLEQRLRTLYATRTDKTLYVMGDGRLPYGRIVEAIDAAKGAGVERVGIVTESMRAGR